MAEHVSCLAPNEVGDLLSGLFSPIAVILLLGTLFLQGADSARNFQYLKNEEVERKNRVAEENFTQAIAVLVARVIEYDHAWKGLSTLPLFSLAQKDYNRETDAGTLIALARNLREICRTLKSAKTMPGSDKSKYPIDLGRISEAVSYAQNYRKSLPLYASIKSVVYELDDIEEGVEFILRIYGIK